MSKGRTFDHRGMEAIFSVGAVGTKTDAQLLELFGTGQGRSAHIAFDALVRRHGPMVLRVCRGILDDPHAAEDAFQAVFLVLARKAIGLSRHESLGNWLFGVATRTARKARTIAARRRRHERGAAATVHEAVTPSRDRLDLLPLLYEEVGRLPEKYRSPVVLCHLEGMSYASAASQLGLNEATLRGRLARARGLLRDRLGRRVVALSAGLWAIPPSRTSACAVPTRLAEATRAAIAGDTWRASAVGAVSSPINRLAEAVLRGIIVGKLVAVASFLLIAAGITTGAWFAWDRTSGGETHQSQVDPKTAPVPVGGVMAVEDRGEILGTWETWVTVPSVVDGKPQPPLKIKETWTITAEAITTSRGEEAIKALAPEERSYSYKLGPTTSPKSIDLTSPGTGTLPGIYSLDGDELRVCYGVDERPNKFAHDDRDGPFLQVLKRVGRTPRPVPPLFATSPGGSWVIQPSSPEGMISTRLGVVMLSETAPDGSLHATLAHPGDPSGPEYRPIAFDAARKRYPLQPGYSGTGGHARGGITVSLASYRLDPAILPADRVAHLAVEVTMPGAGRIEDGGGAKPQGDRTPSTPPHDRDMPGP